MDDPEVTAAEAAILLNMEIQQRVVRALADTLAGDRTLHSMLRNAPTPEAMIRGALSAMVVEFMRSPEFHGTVWRELQQSVQSRSAKEAVMQAQYDYMRDADKYQQATRLKPRGIGAARVWDDGLNNLGKVGEFPKK